MKGNNEKWDPCEYEAMREWDKNFLREEKERNMIREKTKQQREPIVYDEE